MPFSSASAKTIFTMYTILPQTPQNLIIITAELNFKTNYTLQ